MIVNFLYFGLGVVLSTSLFHGGAACWTMLAKLRGRSAALPTWWE